MVLNCWRGALALCLLSLFGCNDTKQAPNAKAPRPVTVLTLKKTDPGRLYRVAGTVASWKTEEIGFEVEGRVQFVAEQETRVRGQINDTDGQQVVQGTLLAQLDDTRYRLRVNSAGEQIEAERTKQEALKIEKQEVLPAERQAAVAERKFALADFDRQNELRQRGASTQTDFDRAQANLEQAEAAIKQIDANLAVKGAEITASEARIAELVQSRAEAQRDVDSCRLISPYHGQVARVHVIPGAFVQRGQPVVTVQLMDPINVQFEASAELARQLNYQDMLSVYVEQPDGTTMTEPASVYTIDSVADPKTRTFTVTLILRNEEVGTPVPPELQGQPIATTGELKRVIVGILAESDGQYVDEDAIQQDDRGWFLWKVTNRRISTLAADADPRIEVEKLRVGVGNRRISFLGLWDFRQIVLPPDSDFDPDVHLVAGAVAYPAGNNAATWQDNTILLDRKRWMLRPGDVVGVDLRGRANRPGYYVPEDAILEQSGRTYIFLVDDSDAPQAKRVEVEVGDSADTLRRIRAIGDPPLPDGHWIAADGALFLVDGERVNVVKEVEVRR